MSERDLPTTPDEAREVMDSLTFEPGPKTREDEEALLATLPPAGAEVMVVRSLRIPHRR